MTDTTPATVHVYMGLHAVTRGPTVLKATLGSCLGIALVWRAQGLYALAHCLLPQAPDTCTEPGARYVDQAMRTLLHDMQVPPGKRVELEAYLCGGAQMSAAGLHPEPGMQVGRRNIEAAHQALLRAQIELRASDLGGHVARRLVVDGAEGTVSMFKVAAPQSDAQGPAAVPALSGRCEQR